MHEAHFFSRFSRWAASASGRPSTFLLALAVVLLWLFSGPLFDYSDTWQLFINTATTVITFLMVFLIQGSQDRDTKAIQLKLDELIRAVQGADEAVLDLEEREDQDLEQLRKAYEVLARRSRSQRGDGLPAGLDQSG
jgi:low affinity Fe/Cu permease